MSNARVRQTIVVPTATMTNTQTAGKVALFNPDGSVASTVKKQAAQANSTATDVAGVVTDLNALLVKLRAAGVISS